jgi:hypothetical protein
MRRALPLLLAIVGAAAFPPSIFSQPLDPQSNSVRVNVTINPDGSRTSYEFDSGNHKATATTTGTDGKQTGKIVYKLDEHDRFASGQVFGPDGKFVFNTTYKYDTGGRILEETRSQQDGTVFMRIVYSYDANGKQSGYSVYDGAGKLLGKTTPALTVPTATPKPKKGGH